MMKVRMKVPSSFRTEKGAGTFTTIRSLIATDRKQNWNTLWNTLETLTHKNTPLIQKLKVAG